VRRGDIWTAAGGSDYAGKPRPVVIIQDDRFETRESVTICSLTSDPTFASVLRLNVEPSVENGLMHSSRLMVDKITTIPRSKMGRRIGRLGNSDMLRLNEAIVIFLRLTE